MKATILYGPRDVRFEERETPKITKPTDAIMRISATCVCGSDLWPYRGLQPVNEPTPMGHEYCGIVEEVGSEVQSVKPGQFVIGSFATSDNTCPHCKAGYQSSCVNREWMLRAQAPVLRVPLADGTLVPTPGIPSDDLIPSLLATSDVLGTGWFAAVRPARGKLSGDTSPHTARYGPVRPPRVRSPRGRLRRVFRPGVALSQLAARAGTQRPEAPLERPRSAHPGKPARPLCRDVR